MSDLNQRISEYLEGTCKTEFEAADMFDVDEDLVLQAVVDLGEVERCSTCSWWCEISDLSLVDDEYICTDCNEDRLEEESE